MYFKKDVLKNFAIFTENHQCWSLFLIKRLQHRCLFVNIAKFLRIPFFYRAPSFAASEATFQWLIDGLIAEALSGTPQKSNMKSFTTIANDL